MRKTGCQLNNKGFDFCGDPGSGDYADPSISGFPQMHIPDSIL